MGQTYRDDEYPVPSEDEYYQQDPSAARVAFGEPGGGGSGGANGSGDPADGNGSVEGGRKAVAAHSRSRSSSISSQKRSTKPMPKESSFFLFSSKNR